MHGLALSYRQPICNLPSHRHQPALLLPRLCSTVIQSDSLERAKEHMEKIVFLCVIVATISMLAELAPGRTPK